MGQATTGLYSLLGARCRNLKLHEWKGGKLESTGTPSTYSGLAAQGNYLLAEAPGVAGVWGALYSSVTQKHPLVLLPPSSAFEREILLKQLPASPPPGAVLVLFTSGTTGEPKAVFHSEKSLLASVAQCLSAFPGSGPTVSFLAPWAMAGVMFHCLLPAARGSDVLFSAEPVMDWADDALRLLREKEAELVSLNPFILEMLLHAGLDDSWKGQVVSLTAPLKQKHKDDYRKVTGRGILEIYGMTEAAGPVLLDGKSIGAELRLSPGHELELAGEQLFLGYGAQGSFKARGQWFSTGDIFREDASTFVHLSRIKDMINLGGRKVPPALIEAAFEGMPELAECLAFPKMLAGVERVALAYVRAKENKLSKEELSRLVEKRANEILSKDLRPHWWAEIEKVPRSSSGKPDRRALK